MVSLQYSNGQVVAWDCISSGVGFTPSKSTADSFKETTMYLWPDAGRTISPPKNNKTNHNLYETAACYKNLDDFAFLL